MSSKLKVSTLLIFVAVVAICVRVAIIPKEMEVLPLSSLDAAIKDEFAVVFVQLDWVPLFAQRETFKEIARAHRKNRRFSQVSFRMINFTEVSDGYAPLSRIPGWSQHDPGPNAHQINGVGEIIWLHDGKIVGIGRLDGVDGVDELLALTSNHFSNE